MPKTTIDDWLNVPAVMITPFGKVKGTIKYGVRIPIAPATTPLHECKPNSQEKIDGQKPRYWFANDELAIKVRMLSYKVNEDSIIGKAHDVSTFNYSIRRI